MSVDLFFAHLCDLDLGKGKVPWYPPRRANRLSSVCHHTRDRTFRWSPQTFLNRLIISFIVI